MSRSKKGTSRMPATCPPNLEQSKKKSSICADVISNFQSCSTPLKNAVSFTTLQAKKRFHSQHRSLSLFQPRHLRALDGSRFSPSTRKQLLFPSLPLMLQVCLPHFSSSLLQTTAPHPPAWPSRWGLFGERFQSGSWLCIFHSLGISP